MSTYDKMKVDEFVDRLDSDLTAPFYFIADLERNDCIVRSRYVIEFSKLNLWEQVNVIHGITERINRRLTDMRKSFSVVARKDDDERNGVK